MHPAVATAISTAKGSLEEHAAPEVTPAGAFQIERQGSGDVQALEVVKKREVKVESLDGNITSDAFDRIW